MSEWEETVNRFSDTDVEWWPFLFLRPARTAKMGSLRVAALAVLHGVFLGVVANVGAALEGHRVHPALLPVCLTVALFFAYRFTIALCWNRRAEKISRFGRPVLVAQSSRRRSAFRRSEDS